MSRGFIGALADLTEWRQGAYPEWHLNLVLRDVGGGRQTRQGLDAIAEVPSATALNVSGLDQAGFEYLVTRHAERLTAIHFWKCPRIVDLSPLETLPGLTHVAFYWNQRATRLWNFAKTPRLAGLSLRDFTRLPRLDDLAGATSLDDLRFGNAVWAKWEVETLAPLSGLSNLRTLNFNPKRIRDNRIEPLADVVGLTDLDFPSGLFSVSQLCWLRARLPDSVVSTVLAPFRMLRQPLEFRGKSLDVLVNGKRGPFLSSTADQLRISRLEAAFDARVTRFRADRSLSPGD